MTVSSGEIINKMITELQKAKTVNENLSQVKIHLEKVQVLSELLLDESVSDKVTKVVHKQLTEKPQVEMNPMRVVQAEPSIVENQEDSIFDF